MSELTDFELRKRSALQKLAEQQDWQRARHNRQLLSVYDTGVGGAADHNYACNQRARHNGTVDRSEQLTWNNIKSVVNGVEAAQDSQELWEFIRTETMYVVLPGKESLIKTDGSGSIDWYKCYRLFDKQEHPNNSYEAVKARLDALHAVYSCFWS